MPDYYLKLSYDGTNYQGYQFQPGNTTTIQGSIEATLAEIHRRPIRINGCGRTDAGVHASQYYGHVALPEAPGDHYLFILNKRLAKGLAVHELIPVHDLAHARFDATERTYDFFFHTHPDAFLERFSSLVPPLEPPGGDFSVTNAAPAAAPLLETLALLRGTHDFRAFCKTPDRHNTTVCELREIKFYISPDGRHYRFRFVANRFLRGMIRVLANDLINVLRGETAPQTVLAWLGKQERAHIFRQAPPQGLFLTGVRYPYINRTPELPSVHTGSWIEVK